MNPLIEITTVPIEIKMTTKSATLEYTRGTAEMEISRSDDGKTAIRTRSITVQQDRYEPSGGSGGRLPAPVVRGSNQSNQTGWQAQAAYEVTGTFASQGELLVNARLAQPPMPFAGTGQDAEAQPQQLPEAQPPLMSANTAQMPAAAQTSQAAANGEAQEGNMQVRYEMDKIQFDWKVEQGEFTFTPGDIEFKVEQKPDVIIKYLGGPIYVPPSSDPNYEPVDVRA